MNREEFNEFITSHNGFMNCYSTIYDFSVVNENTKIDSSVILDRIFLDFDAHGEPLENAQRDFVEVANTLQAEGIMQRTYFSGKGFHIIAYGESMTGAENIRKIQQYFYKLAEGYPTLDSSGVQTTRLRRIPNTLNMSCERYCIPLRESEWSIPMEEVLALSSQPRPFDPIVGERLIQWPVVVPLKMTEVEIEVPDPIGRLPIVPCLHNAIMVQNPSHSARVHLVMWYRDILASGERSVPYEQQDRIIEMIMDELEVIANHEDIWLDWNPNVTKKYVTGMVRKGYHAAGCHTLMQEVGCPGRCWRYDDGEDSD